VYSATEKLNAKGLGSRASGSAAQLLLQVAGQPCSECLSWELVDGWAHLP
jgi:hypothetical protein